MADERKPRQVTQVSEGKPGMADKVNEALGLIPTAVVVKEVWKERMLPWLKDGVIDLILAFLEMKSGRRRGGYRSGSSSGFTSYSGYSRRSASYSSDDERVVGSAKADRFDFSRLRNRNGDPFSAGEMEEIMNELSLRMEDYHKVRVSDFNTVVGRTGDWNDSNWGWTDMRDLTTRRCGAGWIFDFAPPIALR